MTLKQPPSGTAKEQPVLRGEALKDKQGLANAHCGKPSNDADNASKGADNVMRKIYHQHLNGCFVATPGSSSSNGSSGSYSGLTRQVCQNWTKRLGPALENLQTAWRERTIPLLRIADREDDIVEAEAAYAQLAKGARTIVFFGTGGSALGGQALAQLGGWGIPGVSAPDQKERPRTRFYDNLDAETLDGLLRTQDLPSTRFVVISKSGGTAETLTQFMATVQAVKAAGLGSQIHKMFLGLSEPPVDGRSNGLRALCREFSIPVLDHDPCIGGRFAALTNVGLLPALARGLDVRAIRAGARTVIEEMMNASSPVDFPPAEGAALTVALEKEAGITVQVLMPYADKLEHFAKWYVQLWAESLGKNGNGSTPVALLGPVGQHSQLQLFMDGPRNHLITLMSVRHENPGPVIDRTLSEIAGVGYLGGHHVGDLITVQADGVKAALGQAGRPVRSFVLSRLDEQAMGALMMHFMLETILAASLLEVDPFDQPAVELAKIIARTELGG